MALVINDRVKESSTTTGTGTFDLAGVVSGFEGFVAGIGTGNTTYYTIFNQGTTEWEVGVGTITDATADTLARTTVISSSNSDAAVNFTSGTKDVFCTMPASKVVYLDASTPPVPVGAASAGFALAMAVALQEKIMAQDFRNTLARQIGTGDTTILTAGNYDAVIGIRCCNVAATTILVDVKIAKGGNDYFIAKGVNIPPNSAIELIQGGAKIVLASGDVLEAVSDTASSLDVVMSYIDTISSQEEL